MPNTNFSKVPFWPHSPFKMSATGNPESAMITKRLHTLEDAINSLQNMCKRIYDNGERRLKSTMTDLPSVVVGQCILDNISIEGATPLKVEWIWKNC